MSLAPAGTLRSYYNVIDYIAYTVTIFVAADLYSPIASTFSPGPRPPPSGDHRPDGPDTCQRALQPCQLWGIEDSQNWVPIPAFPFTSPGLGQSLNFSKPHLKMGILF